MAYCTTQARHRRRRCRRASTRRSCWPGWPPRSTTSRTGRIGWNIVTSAEDRAAQNFGLDKLYEHDLRYDMADEYLDLVMPAVGLVGARRGGHGPRDAACTPTTPRCTTIDFEGQFYKSRGPAQHRAPAAGPTRCSARPARRPRAATSPPSTPTRSSPSGNDRRADEGVPRRHPRRGSRATAASPTTARCCSSSSPVVGETDDEARAQGRPLDRRTRTYIEYVLAEISSITEVDFSQFDLDEPLPDGHHQRRAGHARARSRRTAAARRCGSSIGLGLVETRRPRRHARTRSPTRWARSWRRSAATASSSPAR